MDDTLQNPECRVCKILDQKCALCIQKDLIASLPPQTNLKSITECSSGCKTNVNLFPCSSCKMYFCDLHCKMYQIWEKPYKLVYMPLYFCTKLCRDKYIKSNK